MRLLNVISDTNRRGAQVFALDLETALKARGHEVSTVALVPGLQQAVLDVPTLGTVARSPGTVRNLRNSMKRFDLTVAHGSTTGLACAMTGLPYVYRQISDSRFWANTLSRRIRVAAYLRRPRLIVALSTSSLHTLHDYLRIPLQRIVTIPNGVPPAVFAVPSASERTSARISYQIEPHTFSALFAGALVPEKGAHVAVEAMGLLGEGTLLVAGDGPELESLKRLANRFADGRVRFIGAQQDMTRAYAASDVLVLPSLGGDSMPAVLIEAGLMAIPSISTPVGSIPDVVLHGETGLIVPVGDTRGLAEALERIRSSSPLREALGEGALRHCTEHFGIDVVAEQWEQALVRLLDA